MSSSVAPVEQLAQQIAELARSVDKLQHTWLTRIREFDTRDGWAATGCISMVAWLAWWTHTSAKAASEHVRVARALGNLPLIDAAFADGRLSYSKVRALTRIATPEQQESLIDLAMGATASQLDKIVAGLRRALAHANPENVVMGKVPRRYTRFASTEDGMVRITAQVGPEEALILEAAMRATHSPAGDSEPAPSSPVASGPNSPAGDSADFEASQTDALVAVARGYLEREPATRGSGFDLIMMTTPERLAVGPDGVGGFLRDGTPLPLHVARAIACDARRIDVSVGESGEILDVGRARRTIPTAINRALALRDGGCRVPGCGRTRHVEAHHVEAWAEGGKTAVSNLVLLCSGHHTAVHEGRLRVELRGEQLEFRTMRGLPIHASPRPEIEPEAIEDWIEMAAPGEAPVCHWDGRTLDLHDVVGWMMLAKGFRSEQRPWAG